MQPITERDAFTEKIRCYADEKPIKDWSRRLSSLISTMDIEVDTRHSQFEYEWMHIPLGATDLNFFTTTGQHTVFHHANNARNYELLYLDSGPMTLEHSGMTLTLTPGQLVLVDNQTDWTLHFPERSNCMTMHIDKKWIGRWLAFPNEAIAKPTDREQLWARPFISTLQSIYQLHALNQSACNTHTMAESLGSLASLMLDKGGPANKQLRCHSSQYQTLLQYLNQHYSDNTITAASVADALKISLRQLHKICKNSGNSFASTLMAIRLDAAKNMLKSPNFKAYQIAEIAWACGFSDPSHFCRRYKAEFSYTPEMYRNQVMEGLKKSPNLIKAKR